jgi:Protein of unknown function (DUF1579)
MKTTRFAMGIALIALAGIAGTSVAQEPAKQPPKSTPLVTKPAQDSGTTKRLEKDTKKEAVQPQGHAPTEAEMDAMMKEMMALAPEHAYLKQYLGTWTTEMTFAHDSEGNKVKGTATFTEVFGGRYIKSDFQSTMEGQPFLGSMTMGFNKNRKQFEGIWIDSMGSQVYMFTGTADSTGKVITTTGSMDSMMGDKTTSKEVTTFSGNTMTFEMFHAEGDKFEKVMTIVYTKADAKPAAAGHGASHADHAHPHPHKEAAPAATKPAPKK